MMTPPQVCGHLIESYSKCEFGIVYVFGVVYEYGIGIVFFCNHIWETIWIVTSNINKEFYLVHTTNLPMHTNQWIDMSWNKELYFIYATNTSNLMCTQATLVHMSNSEIWNNGEIKKKLELEFVTSSPWINKMCKGKWSLICSLQP